MDAGHSGGRRSRRSNRGYTRYRDDNSSWEGDLSLSGTTSLSASHRHTPRSQRGALVPRGTPGYPPEQTFDHDLVNLVDELDAGDLSPSVGEAAAGLETSVGAREEVASQRASYADSPDSQVGAHTQGKFSGRGAVRTDLATKERTRCFLVSNFRTVKGESRAESGVQIDRYLQHADMEHCVNDGCCDCTSYW